MRVALTYLLQRLDGKDLSNETSIYKQALQSFVQGKGADALALLNEDKIAQVEQATT